MSAWGDLPTESAQRMADAREIALAGVKLIEGNAPEDAARILRKAATMLDSEWSWRIHYRQARGDGGDQPRYRGLPEGLVTDTNPRPDGPP